MDLPSPDTPARFADLCKALGDPTRLSILLLLARAGEAGVTEVRTRLGMAQPLASHHLSVLRQNRLVASRTAKRQRIYRWAERVAVGAGLVTTVGVGGLRVTVQRRQKG